MIFTKKNKIKKTILVISDLHLGAGINVKGKRNYLEDFHHDKELVEFLDYYSMGDYANQEVELVINGDFLDFLAVPFVPYFDDEFWSESAAVEKLQMIIDAHPQVMDAMDRFLSKKNKKIVYIVGNHDGELVLSRVRRQFTSWLSKRSRENFSFYLEGDYSPLEGVLIKHGHEYEIAHKFDMNESVIESISGEKYFLPPWGSYYVTRVVNKFKEERSYINQVQPIRTFLIYGLIFDTVFTLRFMLSNAYYFIMVRFLYLYRKSKSIKGFFRGVASELDLFHDSETLTRDFFSGNEMKVLIIGHTHDATFHTYADGSTLVNTGTWMKMVNLNFFTRRPEIDLTYCQIDVAETAEEPVSSRYQSTGGAPRMNVCLNSWKGKKDVPYDTF